MKAGILEVADVLIVNKSDLPGADQLVSDLEDSLELRRIHREERADEWKVPVVAVGAREARGLDDVLEAVAAHRAHLERGDLAERRLEKRAEQVRRMVLTCLEERLRDDAGVGARVDSSLRSAVPPYDVAREILGEIHGAIGAATVREEVNP
jgi:LAO/AO transport system kinase